MSWPANSPDLNPIEHVLDMLGRQIAAHSHPPSYVTELKRALQVAWNRLSPQLIHHLIASRTVAYRDGGLLYRSSAARVDRDPMTVIEYEIDGFRMVIWNSEIDLNRPH
ncbi:transposable element Tc3 transposase [Trichonephila clavipes]|nr:transposable element Tc3 transposase [Trichonephila clavipes]